LISTIDCVVKQYLKRAGGKGKARGIVRYYIGYIIIGG
jgi:hypothetical protein